MKLLFAIVLPAVLTLGCAGTAARQQNLPTVVDPLCTACVAGCLRLGMLAETADAGNPFGFWATRRMVDRLNARAVRLKATHLVWLHRTSTSAAAEAYRCPLP